MLSTSDKGMNVIRAFEGVALRAYRDPVGVWTIGYGLTNMDKGIPWTIKAGLTITRAEAEKWLGTSLKNNYEPSVRSTLANPTQAQFDAGVSFHYNTGAIRKATWPKNLNAGDMPAARLSILSWNKAGGKVLAGLTRRRKREWAMIESGNYGPEGSATPVTITRNEDDNSSTGSRGVPTTDPGVGMLGLHDAGPEVKEAQGWLIKLKLLPKGSDSGTFDEATEDAVKRFQGSHPRLTKDGVVGPATRSALVRDVSASAPAKAAAGQVVGPAVVSAGAAWAAVGSKVALVIVSITGVVLLVGAVYVGVRYRDEIRARVNRILGRETA